MDKNIHKIENWNHLRKKYKIMEYIAIAVIVICAIVGLISDVCVGRGYVWHEIVEINTLSLTMLQIQASISTLTIALVALISGNISDEYMGVSISNYYLNIRPVILKQKTIILSVIGLLFINVALHQWKLYNIVICLFWATGILILLSVIELYALFRGKSAAMKEIEDYIIYILKGNHSYEKKRDIFHNFSHSWIEQITKQSQYEYEKYMAVFTNSMQSLLIYKDDRCIQDIESECINVGHCFLSETSGVSKKGIYFLSEIYEIMWTFVRDNDLKNLGLKARFSVFSQVMPELVRALNKMTIDEVEGSLNWKYLSDDIARVAIEFNLDATTSDRIGELESVLSFSQYLGRYIKRQRIQNGENNIINYALWGDILTNLYFSTYNVSFDGKEIYLLHKTKMYFSYCYGLILNDLGFIVKEYFYYDSMSDGYLYNNQYFDLLCLSIHCYLYYLSEKENDTCVEQEVRASAKGIIEDIKVKNIFQYFLYNSFSKSCHFLELDVEKIIYDIISRYELHPKHVNVKTMIIGDVIREFYVFSILYVRNKYYIEDILTQALKNEMLIYYINFLGEKESYTKTAFSKLYTLVEAKKTQEEIGREVNLLYNQLNTYVTTKYKQKAILEAEKRQEEYADSVDESAIIDQIKEQVYAHINETFESVIAQDLPKKNVMKFHLLRCIHFTETIKEEKINGYFSSIDGALVNNIAVCLLQERAISEKSRKNFFDDLEYIQLLKDKNVKLLMGSEFILKNQDYKKKKVFEEYAENCKCIFTGYTKFGLALIEKGVRFSIEDVNVSIHSMTFEESDSKYESDEDKFMYNIKGSIPAYFEKEELEKYIYNERKILDVSIKINLSMDGKDLGYVFCTE